jgi:V8-like Glu-specific endopeptidase
MKRSLFLTILLVGCGGTDPAEAPGRTSAALRAGSLDAADPGVVAVVQDGTLACSGVVVGPRAVLTAAHCVVSSETTRRALSHVRIGSGNATEGGTLLPITGMTVHPQFHQEEDGTFVHDLAVIMLGTATTVALLELAAATPDLKTGATLRVVGFGADDSGGDVGLKRTGKVHVASVTDDQITIAADPSMICAGDSGGPALLTVGARELVVGVASYHDGSCGQEGAEARVDTHRPFIDAAVSAANSGQGFASGRPVGAECVSDGECESLACTGEPGAPAKACRKQCQLEGGCGAGGGECRFTGRNPVPYACFTTPAPPSPYGPEDVVVPAEKPPSEGTGAGCAVGRAGDGSALTWAPLLALLIARRRRSVSRG